jgi:hypothetical protein
MNSFEQNEERIKADVNSVIQSVSNGQPDMERLKEAGSDILSTAASLLSNSGIDGLTGNSGGGVTAGNGVLGNSGIGGLFGGGSGSEPGSGSGAQAEAGDIFKKLRDGLGLDGNALDGLQKAADELKNKL